MLIKKSHVNRIFAKVKKNILRADILFLLLGVTATGSFIAITPQAWGLDEQVHAARVYQISDGGFYPDKLPKKYAYGGSISLNLKVVLEEGWGAGNNISGTDKSRKEPFYAKDRKDTRANLDTEKLGSRPIDSEKKAIYEFGPTGPYSPIAYAPAVVGMSTGRGLHANVNTTLTLARISQAVFYIGLVAFSLWLLRNSKARWLVFVVALLPESIYQAATINIDGYTNAIVILFFAVVYRLFTQKKLMSDRMDILLWVSSLGLAFTKPSYAIGLFAILFLPRTLFRSRKEQWIKKAALFTLSLVVLAVVSLKGLQYSDATFMYLTPDTIQNVDMKRQLLFILDQPLHFASVMGRTMIDNTYEWQAMIVGRFGYNVVFVPYIIAIPILFAGIISILYASGETKRIAAWLFTAIGVASAASAIVLLYLTFSTVGQASVSGVQGRYFIPSLIFMLVGVGSLLNLKLSEAKKGSIAIIIPICVAITLYGSIYVYAKALF